MDGSDDEKDKESEDEYEVDNSVFVPHGYLSDDEGDGDENEEILVSIYYCNYFITSMNMIPQEFVCLIFF